MKNDESFDRLVRRDCVAGSLYRDGAEVNRKDEEGVSAKKLELSPHFWVFVVSGGKHAWNCSCEHSLA